MPTANIVGILIVIVIAVVLQFVLMAAEDEDKNRIPTPVSHLRSMLQLTEHSMWHVTILRRSGYDQSAWYVPGSRDYALDLALEKMRSREFGDTILNSRNSGEFGDTILNSVHRCASISIRSCNDL
jgi:hypothetical protein